MQQAFPGELGIDALAKEDNTSPTKLLNAEVFAIIVLECAGRRVLLHSESATPLQVVDRNAVEWLRMAGSEAEAFKRKIRVAMTDAAGYNLRCERHILRVRSGDWSRFTRVLDVSHADVHAQGAVGAIGVGLQRADGRRHRLVGRSAETAPANAAIVRCASGDWRKAGVFEFYAKHGETFSEALAVLLDHFVPVVLAHTPTTFPRSRCTGADETMKDIGLLTCIHSLFVPVYRDCGESLWARRFGNAPPTNRRPRRGCPRPCANARAKRRRIAPPRSRLPGSGRGEQGSQRRKSLQWLSHDPALETFMS